MKAKTILGMIACASACVSLSAFGNETNGWFSVSASGSALTKEACSVTTNTVEITAATEGRIVLDNDKDSALVIAPSAPAAKGDGVVKITGTALLTPSSTNDFTVTDNAKAGFAVGVFNDVTNFYGYANGVWYKLSGQPANYNWDGDTTFSLLLDYRVPSVQFYLGSTLLTGENSQTSFNLASGTTSLSGIDAFGSGSIASIDSKYEVAVAIGKDGKKYGSTVEAVNTTGAGSIQVIDPDTGSAVAQQTAANGLQLWECDVLNVETNATLALGPATKAVANKITLKLAVDPDPGVTVKFGVNDGTSTTGSYDPDAIEIPMTTGAYTIVPTITAAP